MKFWVWGFGFGVWGFAVEGWGLRFGGWELRVKRVPGRPTQASIRCSTTPPERYPPPAPPLPSRTPCTLPRNPVRHPPPLPKCVGGPRGSGPRRQCRWHQMTSPRLAWTPPAAQCAQTEAASQTEGRQGERGREGEGERQTVTPPTHITRPSVAGGGEELRGVLEGRERTRAKLRPRRERRAPDPLKREKNLIEVMTSDRKLIVTQIDSSR